MTFVGTVDGGPLTELKNTWVTHRMLYQVIADCHTKDDGAIAPHTGDYAHWH